MGVEVERDQKGNLHAKPLAGKAARQICVVALKPWMMMTMI